MPPHVTQAVEETTETREELQLITEEAWQEALAQIREITRRHCGKAA